MKCEEAKSLLTKYLLGDLEESQASEVREHIERCADCSAEALEIQPTLDLLREALTDTAPAPAKLDRSKHYGIFTAKQRGRVIAWVADDYPWVRKAAVALVMIGFIGLLSMVVLPMAKMSCEAPMVQVQILEMEPVEELEDINEEILLEPPVLEAVDSVEVRAYGGMAARTVAPAPVDGYAEMPSVEDAGEVIEDAVVNSVNGAAASDPTATPGPVAGFSPKPAAFDSVAIVKSPVIMKGIYGNRSPGARGAALAGFGGGASADAPVPPEGAQDDMGFVYDNVKEGGSKLKSARPIQDGSAGTPRPTNLEDVSRGRAKPVAESGDLRQANRAERAKEALVPPKAEEPPVSGKDEVYYRYLPSFKAVEKNDDEDGDTSKKANNLKLSAEPPLAAKGFSGAVIQSGDRDKKRKKRQEIVTTELEADKVVQIENAPAGGTIYRKDGGQASGLIRHNEASQTYEIATGAVTVKIPEESVSRIVIKETIDKLEAKAEEDARTTRFKAYGVNPVMNVSENAFSTFSIDVDTASYTLARNYIAGGYLPPAEAVRTEEVVNYFEYDYKAPLHRTFDVFAEAAPSKFGHGQFLLKIGVKGRRLGREEQRRAVLTFLIDSSGSMETEDRIGLVKKSLKMLVDKLNDDDIVNIIQYDTRARLVLSGVKAENREKIRKAVDGLQCSGSTNLEGGIDKAYEVAAKNFISKGENRVLLLSDGVANLGAMDAESILAKVERYRKQGIYCSVFGVGMGTYDDQMLETLANKGDGMYRFLDSEEEAKRLFVDDLSATLNTIARDVKIQVEFNKQFVKTYRQLGYENRQLKKEQFRDDAVDAGEVGSGQSVTALYEIGMNPAGYKNAQKRLIAEPVATVRVRYRRVDNDAVEEIEIPVTFRDFVNDFDKADVRFRLAACAAEFAEILRGSPYAEGSSMEQVSKVLAPIKLELDLDQRVQEFYRLTTSATGMARGEGN